MISNVEYIIHCRSSMVGIHRNDILKKAWGEPMPPVSYVQDNEKLSAAKYLDIKIDKWSYSSRWKNIQPLEPWIRLEFMRGSMLEKALKSKMLVGASELKFKPQCTILAKLDGKSFEQFDYLSLARLVLVLAEFTEASFLSETTFHSLYEFSSELDLNTSLVASL